MWEKLTYTDLQRAREQLTLSREVILKRHADELTGLDTEAAELDTLRRLLGDFARKFKGAAGGRSPASGPPAAEAKAEGEAPEPEPEPAPAEETAEAGDGATAVGEPEPEPAPASEPELETEVAAKPEEDAVVVTTVREKNAAAREDEPRGGRGRQTDERGAPRTNFDVFNRALSKHI